MKNFFVVFFLLALAACAPRKTTNLNIINTAENKDLILPLHVVAIDAGLRDKLNTLTAEEYFKSRMPETISDIQIREMDKGTSDVVVASRTKDRKDFVIILDLYDYQGSGQKLMLASAYYKSKDVYLSIDDKGIQVVSKEQFEKLRAQRY